MTQHSGVTLITGANGGVGIEVVKYLLKKGHKNLVCHYKSSADKLLPLLKEYDLDPAKHSFAADLTKEDEVKKLKDDVLKAHGRVWGLVNLAGASSNSMFWKLSVDEFQRVINANILTTFLSCREFAADMRQKEGGRIVNISSVTAYTGVAGAAHYCASKAAIVGLTKGMALELARKNITVNAIALGYFEYGMINDVSHELQKTIQEKIPMQRFGQAADVGSLLVHLLSPEASYLTGQVLHLNGGQYS